MVYEYFGRVVYKIFKGKCNILNRLLEIPRMHVSCIIYFERLSTYIDILKRLIPINETNLFKPVKIKINGVRIIRRILYGFYARATREKISFKLVTE